MKSKEKTLIIDTKLTIDKIEETKNKILNLMKKNQFEQIFITTEQIDLTGIQLIISLKKTFTDNHQKTIIEFNQKITEKLKNYGFETLIN